MGLQLSGEGRGGKGWRVREQGREGDRVAEKRSSPPPFIFHFP